MQLTDRVRAYAASGMNVTVSADDACRLVRMAELGLKIDAALKVERERLRRATRFVCMLAGVNLSMLMALLFGGWL